MKYLDCTLICLASYNGRLPLPKEIDTLEEAISYAKERLNEVPLGEMEYISESDMLDEENCFIVESDTIK